MRFSEKAPLQAPDGARKRPNDALKLEKRRQFVMFRVAAAIPKTVLIEEIRPVNRIEPTNAFLDVS